MVEDPGDKGFQSFSKCLFEIVETPRCVKHIDENDEEIFRGIGNMEKVDFLSFFFFKFEILELKHA